MSIEKQLELHVILEEMVQNCSFSVGQDLVLHTKPSYDPLVIKRDNARIREALAATVHNGPMPIQGIHDIRDALKEAEKGGTITPQDLLHELHLIRGIRQIIQYTNGLDISHEALSDLVDTLVVHDAMEKAIQTCIDDYGEVMDSASPTLKQVRQELSRIDQVIAEAVQKFIAMHASQVVDQIVTYRNDRAVVLVKAQDKNTFGGYVYGDSASGQASYVEPQALIGPNNRKQELLFKEKEEIARILHELSSSLGKVAGEEIANIETVALLDALFAKAIWGKDRDAIVAHLQDEKVLDFKKARHPLIDPKMVIANDYHIGEGKNVLLITGPNTGGKTVSMKIIGLFVLMTYCGMPIPCKEASIPFFDHVFVDIGDEQSVVSSLSSFSAHVQKLSEVLNTATHKSLALLDEIGSGTDPREGESLAIAVLNELRERETMVVATTHYGRLKTYGKRHEDILLASVQFDMDALKPTYHYLEGITGQSNALEVAERNGLPKNVIKYARFLKNQARNQEDIVLEQLEAQLNQNQQKEILLEEKIQELEQKEKELTKLQKQLQYEKDNLHAKIDREKEEILSEARNEADEILARMRKMEGNAKYHEALEQRQKLHSEEAAVADDETYSFEVGDIVELKESNQVARIVEKRKKDFVIELNGRKMHIKENQIIPSLKVLPQQKPEMTMHVSSHDIFKSMPVECNLIGLYVDEAMEQLEAYVDDAILHGLKQFRVIHGDGSGALRKAVHQYLSKRYDVDEFRLGMPQEGGTGATVVKLKD